MTADQIQTRVLARLDELSVGDMEPVVPATAMLDALEQSARDVLVACDTLHLAGLAEDVAAETALVPLRRVDEVYDTHARLRLPAGTLRVVRVKFASWIVPLRETRLTTTQSDAYEAFLDRSDVPSFRYPAAFVDVEPGTGTGGGLALVAAPFVDIGIVLASGLVAETVDALEELVVVRNPQPERVPAALIDALVWRAAERLLESYLREAGLAAAAQAEYLSAMRRASAETGRYATRAPEARVTTRPYRPYG